MRVKIKCLAILISIFFIGLTVSASSARDSLSKGMNDKQLAQLAVDIHEINNLMSLHSWYHAASMNDVELKEIWSKRDDIVWAQNSGYWIGPKAIKDYYGKTVKRESTKGSFVWHTITTPVVEVARDRNTAKGVWYTPGVVGGFEMGFQWMFEKYGVDFIREDGVWKVWHMHVYTDTAWPLGGKIEARAVGDGSPTPGAEKSGQEIGAAPAEAQMQPTKAVKNYEELSPTTEIKLVPRPPVPYNTFSETWSYVADGE